MSSEPAIRELREGDLPAVAALLGTQWPDVDWPLRFRRQWRDQPATATTARGFVHERDGRLLGCFGSIAVPYQVAGRAALACVATALCVHAAARGQGIAKALVAAFDAQPADLHVNATPNAASATMFRRLGYTPIDPAAGRRLLAHARQPFGALRKAWRLRGRGGLRALFGELVRRRPAAAPGLVCAPLAADTADLDQVWQRQRSAHATTLWRDRATLHWLVFADPRNTVLGCRDAGGVLRGYATYRTIAGERRQIDVFPAHDPEVLVALALAGAADAARTGATVLHLLSVPAAAAAALIAHGFEPIADDLTVFVRGDAPPGSWFTRLDGDRWL